MKKALSLITFLVLVFVLVFVSSRVTIPEVSAPAGVYGCGDPETGMTSCEAWYPNLNKPSWQPPAYVFGPVWTILYIMIAISGWLVWNKLPKEKKFTNLIIAPYWLQLLLNFLWSIFFFGMHQPILSCIDIICLIVVIALNFGTFVKVSKGAAYLLVPYFIWVCYAASLNAAIVVLN